MRPRVTCAIHGDAPAAVVCGHLVASERDGKPRGLHQEVDSDGTPNAWCDACEITLAEGGGGWTKELTLAADIAVICGTCFEKIVAISGNQETLQ